LLRRTPDLPAAARRRAAQLHAAVLAAGLVGPTPEAAVTSAVIGEASAAVAAAEDCWQAGVRVGCFRPPSVPDGESRLRLTARADLSDDDLAQAAAALTAVAAQVARP
jgi:8-amino-7-oxononanoate synthase